VELLETRGWQAVGHIQAKIERYPVYYSLHWLRASVRWLTEKICRYGSRREGGSELPLLGQFNCEEQVAFYAAASMSQMAASPHPDDRWNKALNRSRRGAAAGAALP
jgi:hypothetical protein